MKIAFVLRWTRALSVYGFLSATHKRLYEEEPQKDTEAKSFDIVMRVNVHSHKEITKS